MNPVFSSRHKTESVRVGDGNKSVLIGGASPIVVQSMTNTATEDVDKTVQQIRELAEAGSELVRMTVNTPAAARAVPYIRQALEKISCFVPLVGDFHYNGHKLLKAEPACAEALSKYRINPGNVGKGTLHEENFATMIETACRFGKAVRIGVNGGSLDKELLEKRIAQGREAGLDAKEVFLNCVIESTLESARAALSLGLKKNQLVLSAKVSSVPDLVYVYRRLAAESSIPLHVGLTEAGIGTKGLVASTAALSILLAEGIGDTIRVSITPEPGKTRSQEVLVAREVLQSLGLRRFCPFVTSCPGCGRTNNALFESLVHATQEFVTRQGPVWKKEAPGSESMRIAVMGCVVNGPGEATNADIGVSLPGRGEAPVAPVFADGKKIATLKGDTIASDFQTLVEQYVRKRWSKNA